MDTMVHMMLPANSKKRPSTHVDEAAVTKSTKSTKVGGGQGTPVCSRYHACVIVYTGHAPPPAFHPIKMCDA